MPIIRRKIYDGKHLRYVGGFHGGNNRTIDIIYIVAKVFWMTFIVGALGYFVSSSLCKVMLLVVFATIRNQDILRSNEAAVLTHR